VTAVVFAVATIANNNLQDLKTGQLVDATPWKQQVALVFGVLAGAAIIPPILDLLNHAYGFAGAPGVPRTNPLPAPQAGLISALAQGVLQNNVDWSLIGVGIAIGVVMIIINAALRRATNGRVHLAPLAVGLGIYLPTQSTMMVVFGALAGWYFDRRADRQSDPAAVKQLGVLLASGLIVGEGLVGVLVAAVVAFSGKDFPLSLVGDHFAATDAVVLSCIGFTATMFFMYRWVGRLHR
jgi:putative OPT family oligopeptide transporter